MDSTHELVLSVSDFVAVLNQTLEFAYPSVLIQGELANLRVSKNKWLYFDLKDEYSTVKFFGLIYNLPGPLEDGMLLKVRGQPRLHNLYGFSVNVQTIQTVGEGSIKRAAALLEAKLAHEGLFDDNRKRSLPYPPERIGLITSAESAAYHDFVKVLRGRWGGLEIVLANVQVQGEAAPAQIVAALEHFNTLEEMDVLVITRGGGSAEDLAAFSAENVTRAVAASRTPTLVAIGHEVDISLSELAADKRASTPSNAAELLVPDKRHELDKLLNAKIGLSDIMIQKFKTSREELTEIRRDFTSFLEKILTENQKSLQQNLRLLKALNPIAALKRGYAIIKIEGKVVRSIKQIKPHKQLDISVSDGNFQAEVK
ncbi:MAG TPA: exodeoxyribonuclease VII large subunit [Patescibacteria group bacterium]|nr:exodeoxyribonuclease VII large subunit [Patescibacteria group bacterium]